MISFISQLWDKASGLIITGMISLFLIGAAYAMDQRIDQRVQSAITAFQVQEIERQIQFYITKEELAPSSVTPDDRVNRQVLERQLDMIRGVQ